MTTKLKTLPFFDRALNGGLPRARVTMISGWPGSGKTRLAMQVCAAFLKRRKKAKVAYISGQETTRDVQEHWREILAASQVRGVEDRFRCVGSEPRPALARLLEPGTFQLVVLDAPGYQGKQWGELLKWAIDSGAAVLVLNGFTRDGYPRGGMEAEHCSNVFAALVFRKNEDEAADSDDRILIVDKNRGGPSTKTYLKMLRGGVFRAR